MDFLSILVFISGIILLLLSILSFKKMNNFLMLIFSLMTMGMAIFSFGYGVELISTTLNMAIFSIKLQYLGLSFLSIYWAIFIYKFRFNQYPKSFTIVGFLIVPLIIFFSVMTNELHHLYYKNIELKKILNFYITILEKGILYKFFISYSYSILSYLIYSFFYSWKKNKDNKKIQAQIMLIGSLFPIIFNIIYLFNLTPYGVDPTPIGFLILGFFWYKALINYEYLDLKEITRIAAFEKMSEGVFIVDTLNRIVDFNNYAAKVFNVFSEENIGKHLTSFKIGKDISKLINLYIEIPVKRGEQTYLYEFRKSPIFFRNKTIAYMYIFRDITSTKLLISDLTFLANNDYLTGISNKMYFMKSVEIEFLRAKRYKKNLSVIMLDIDFFKKINDTYGHSTGDEILSGLSTTIKEKIRATDIFGRVGGEEFSILLAETDNQNAILFCEKIRKLIEEKIFVINYTPIKITISLGVTSYIYQSNTNYSLNELMEAADKALYLSKNAGRNMTSYLELSHD